MNTLMIVTGGLGTGGLERISCFIANYFSNKGWKVVILTLLQGKDKKQSFQYLNKNVDVIPFCASFNPLNHKKKAIPYWKKMIKISTRQYNPDSILAMTFKIASLICLFAPRFAKRVTIREISDPKSKVRKQIVNKITEFLCRKVKNIIFQTNWEKSCYGKRTQSKGVVIPNPLSIQASKKSSFTEKRIFTLSRLLLKQKRQDILIKGFEIFHQNHPEYILEIYGEGEDKELVLDLIKNTECSESIKVLGPMPDIHKKIINYRCFVLTSDFEGMSNALLECYSLGIPCVSSDWPGVEDVISDGIDGLLYKRQNHIELAKQLSRIADDDNLCLLLTKNATNNSTRFEKESIIKQYCEVIERG